MYETLVYYGEKLFILSFFSLSAPTSGHWGASHSSCWLGDHHFMLRECLVEVCSWCLQIRVNFPLTGGGGSCFESDFNLEVP